MRRTAGIIAVTLLIAAVLRGAGETPMLPYPQVLAALTIVVMFIHAVLAMGIVNALGFATIIVTCTFAIENVGAETGLPFGNYHFVVAGNLPHVGKIPIIVGPLYFGVGYGAYVIASLIARHRALTVPIAALAMTIWDLCMDPVNSTVNGLWIWHDGGIYFGVPLSNFVGWFSEMTIAFWAAQAFLQARQFRFNLSDTVFWLTPSLLYLAAGLSQVAPWLTAPNTEVHDAAGYIWSTGAIYRASVLVAVLGMLPLTGIAILQLWKKRA